jgi:CO/xanthine dehydrogenase Mo-binding subunit
MAAIANANFNTTGVRIKTLPLSPENVLRALKEEGNA